MDFTWVRQLAEESNTHEMQKQERERARKENERLVALATVPLVEKFFKLVQACSEEFNKHCIFSELRVLMSRTVAKKSMGNYDNPAVEVEEIAYFSFARRNTMYGIRGMNGTIEFIDDIQVSDVTQALNMRLNEMSTGVIYKLVAKVEGDPQDMKKKNVVWTLNDETMDGPRLITLCQQYFSTFIKRTED